MCTPLVFCVHECPREDVVQERGQKFRSPLVALRREVPRRYIHRGYYFIIIHVGYSLYDEYSVREHCCCTRAEVPVAAGFAEEKGTGTVQYIDVVRPVIMVDGCVGNFYLESPFRACFPTWKIRPGLSYTYGEILEN